MLRDFNPPRTKKTYGLIFLRNDLIETINEGIRIYRLSNHFIRLPDIRDAKKKVQQLKELPFNQLQDELYRKYRKHYYELYRASRELKGIEVREEWFKYFNLPATWTRFKKTKDKETNPNSFSKLQLFYKATFGEELITLDENLSIDIFNARIDELHLSWLKYNEFACHSSFGLQEAALTFLAIEENLNDALKESRSKPWFMPQAEYQAYRAYLVDYQKQVEAEKVKIAEAMLRRLQIALNRPGKDDVIEYVIYDLAKLGIDLPKDLLEASRHAPEYKGLTPEVATYFRFFIEQYGNEEQRRNLHESYSFNEVDKYLPLKNLVYGKHKLIIPAYLASSLPKMLRSEDIYYLSIDPSLYKFMRELPRSEAEVSDNVLDKYIRHCHLLNASLSMALAEAQNKLNQISFFTTGKAYKRLYFSGIINLISSFQAQVQNLSKSLNERKQQQAQDTNNNSRNPVISTIRIQRNNKEFLVPSKLESLIPLRPRVFESFFKDNERINFFQTRQALLVLCEKPLPNELHDRAAALILLKQSLQDELEQCFQLQKRLYFWQTEQKMFLDKWTFLLMEKIKVLSEKEFDLSLRLARKTKKSLMKQKYDWESNFENVIKTNPEDIYELFKEGKIYDFELNRYLNDVNEAKQELNSLQTAVRKISSSELGSTTELKEDMEDLQSWIDIMQIALKEREDVYTDLKLFMEKKAPIGCLPVIKIDNPLNLNNNEDVSKLLEPIWLMDEYFDRELQLASINSNFIFEKHDKEWKAFLKSKLLDLIRYKFELLNNILVNNHDVSIGLEGVDILGGLVHKIETDIGNHSILLRDYEQDLCNNFKIILKSLRESKLGKGSSESNSEMLEQLVVNDITNIRTCLRSIASGGFYSDLSVFRNLMYQCQFLMQATEEDSPLKEYYKDKLTGFDELIRQALIQAESFCIEILAKPSSVETENLNALVCFGVVVKLFGNDDVHVRHIKRINEYITYHSDYVARITSFEGEIQLKLQAIELICSELNDELKIDAEVLQLLRQDNDIEEYKQKFAAIVKNINSKSIPATNTPYQAGWRFFTKSNHRIREIPKVQSSKSNEMSNLSSLT